MLLTFGVKSKEEDYQCYRIARAVPHTFWLAFIKFVWDVLLLIWSFVFPSGIYPEWYRYNYIAPVVLSLITTLATMWITFDTKHRAHHWNKVCLSLTVVLFIDLVCLMQGQIFRTLPAPHLEAYMALLFFHTSVSRAFTFVQVVAITVIKLIAAMSVLAVSANRCSDTILNWVMLYALVCIFNILFAWTLETMDREQFWMHTQLRKELQVRSQAEKEAVEARDAEMLFLARMSHEIRTPLNGILGLAELLVDSTLDPEQLVLVQSMKVAGNHLLYIVNDILDLAKVTAGKLQLKEQLVKIWELPNECLHLFTSQMKAKNITADVQVAKDVPVEVIGDRTRLVQIFSNLISNAVKFTPNMGKINIHAWLASVSGLTSEMLEVTFQISDTGKGMTAHEVEQLFVPYYQCNSQIDRDHGGTGLGLSIVDKLVSLMGGKISVESTVGSGTKFKFSLRFKSKHHNQHRSVPRNEAEDQLPIIHWQGMKCIVTDDTPLNVFVLQQRLQRKGVHVLTAGNGQQCVEQWQANTHVDIILMDIWMPVMDGLEATKELRAMGVTVPIIGLTADYTTGIAKQALDAGMTEVQLKPISWNALERVVSKTGQFCSQSLSMASKQLPLLEAVSVASGDLTAVQSETLPGTVVAHHL
uniref:histidine kinase n=1 Tax=Eutreptiella gymnastica TaxID=73025 RepID=A0A7S1IRE9_9EUGL